jgi:hypothetical protein
LGKAGEEIVVLLKSLKTLQQLELAEEFLAEGRGLSIRTLFKLVRSSTKLLKRL